MRRVYVTGGNGFLGSNVVAALAASADVSLVVSGDLRDPVPSRRVEGVTYERADVTDAASLPAQFARHRIDTVVHLASIVNPGKTTTVDQEYRVDVDGSRSVLEAALASGVTRIVVSSSGAAYGYHADNPEWLTETDALRGNDSFPYSRHKRLVEEMLAGYRSSHPELEQVVFRIGTILGPAVSNQITALWDGRRVLAIRGSASPFVFVWVDDVVGAMVQAVLGERTGTFNVAGDGRLTVDEIAHALGKNTFVLPAGVLALALRLGHALRLTVHGPEQVKFLRYRPVLSNTRLKEEFGYVPRLTSAEAFDRYCAAKGLGRSS
jgi:UDP-glucose 4-epimerase